MSRRRRRASLTARKATELLRSEFGAKKVILFGSLARRGGFTLWSDIDIAATGIPPTRFFEAVGAVTGLSAEFKMDLIDLETCPLALHERIQAVDSTQEKALPPLPKRQDRDIAWLWSLATITNQQIPC